MPANQAMRNLQKQNQTVSKWSKIYQEIFRKLFEYSTEMLSSPLK